jgi:uroporphyrinogen-III decarboxylase
LNNTNQIIDRYERLRADRQHLAGQFLSGQRPYMIFQTPNGNVWGDVRTAEQCFYENLEYVKHSFEVPSDHLPVLEPWFGTGVYASMYGCDYVWRNGEAPAVHYKFHSLDEIKDVQKPSWENSEIAQLVLQTIRYFKARTGDAIPIVWTDTQSASDSATLILDACETFIGCLTEPDMIMNFMKGVNDLIIEFSQVQAELIGEALAMPGHIMLSNVGLRGMSISDDNLAVTSPRINRRFNLPLNEEIGKAMGGVAIHSCGNWAKTMSLVKELVPSCVAIDCAVDATCDPNPNEPEAVRDALAGTGIHVHVRLTYETEKMIDTVKRLLHPDLKLIVHPGYQDQETSERNYHSLDRLMRGYYEEERVKSRKSVIGNQGLVD